METNELIFEIIEHAAVEGIPLGENTLHVTDIHEAMVVGSRLHRTNTEESDLDVKLVYSPTQMQTALFSNEVLKPIQFKYAENDVTLVPLNSHIYSLLTGNISAVAYLFNNLNDSNYYYTYYPDSKSRHLRSYLKHLTHNNAFSVIVSSFGLLQKHISSLPRYKNVEELQDVRFLKTLSLCLWLSEVTLTYMRHILVGGQYKELNMKNIKPEVLDMCKKLKNTNSGSNVLEFLDKAVVTLRTNLGHLSSMALGDSGALQITCGMFPHDKEKNKLSMEFLKSNMVNDLMLKSYTSNHKNRHIISETIADIYLS